MHLSPNLFELRRCSPNPAESYSIAIEVHHHYISRLTIFEARPRDPAVIIVDELILNGTHVHRIWRSHIDYIHCCKLDGLRRDLFSDKMWLIADRTIVCASKLIIIDVEGGHHLMWCTLEDRLDNNAVPRNRLEEHLLIRQINLRV